MGIFDFFQASRPLFSEQYADAIANGRLEVEMSHEFRTALADALAASNISVISSTPSPDGLDGSSDVMSEVMLFLDGSFNPVAETSLSPRQRLVDLVEGAPGHRVLDVMQLFAAGQLECRRAVVAAKFNMLFDQFAEPYRLVDGKCIKLDPEFVGKQLGADALERLAAGRFAGATAEFKKAISELEAGDIKNAIADACKSYESVLKVLTGQNAANADHLTKALITAGYLDDLSEHVREAFRQSVLMSLPVIRNKLAGHGQGAEVVDVSRHYGELALQLAASLNNFLVSLCTAVPMEGTKASNDPPHPRL